jgi:hypothetical protein
MLDVLALAAIRRGDEATLEQLIRKYTPYVAAVIRGVGCGNIT